MSENDAERQTRSFLESQGFNVERIPSAPDEQRADYRVTDENDVYIIEVKGRFEDEEYMHDLLEKGEAIREDFVGPTNVVSRQIRDAAEQLRATPAELAAFRVMALVAGGDDPGVQAMQFQSTLYGTVDLLVPAEDGSALAVPCFYFTFNEFFNLRHVDAALILVPGGSRVCLNSFSPRAEEFRHTRLWQLHEREGQICDPEQMEMREEAFIADCDLDRHDEPVLRSYIQNKYGLEHLPLPFKPKKVTAAKVVR